MRWILISLALLTFTTNASAAWSERVSIDRLTGGKTVRVENAASAPIRSRGRMIVPRLSLQCLTPSDGATSYIGVFIVFGEPVVMAPDAKMRLRIDEGKVENRIVGLAPRGDYVQIVAPEEFASDRLRNSFRVRIELTLLDDNAFMEFNTKGANAAIDKIGC
jgi:hypothetical protein